MERENIESLVRRFRERLEAGQRPMIEEVLEGAETSQRLLLLVLLIQNELEFAYLRLTREMDVSADEDDHRVLPRLELYLKRFPELEDSQQSCKEIVSMEFALHYAGANPLTIEHYMELLPQHAVAIKPMLKLLEERLNRTAYPPDRFEPISSHESTVPDSTSEPLKQWKLPKVLGYFHLLSLVGNGGMGSVFRALDLRTGAVCAIKVMRRADSWSVYRFNEEFQVLASLDHPNLGTLYESFYDGYNRYFSMELIAGPSLNRWWQLLPKDADFLSKFQRCLKDIAIGIQFLHENGIVHGDIKPSNIVVSRRGRAVILDFGLSRILGDQQVAESSFKDRALVGTVGYTAPELAQGHPTTFASDWFAFGAILRDLLQSSSWSEKETDLPPEWAKDWKAYCELLEGLRCQLQAIDPNARATGEDVLQTLCESISPVQLGWHHHFHSPFVGRSELLAELKEFASQAIEGQQGRLALVQGPLGIGKTRVLQECRRIFSEEHRAVTLWTRGLRQDGSPFQLVNSLIQAFVNHYLWNPRECLGEEHATLLQVAEAFPQLHQILSHESPIGLEMRTHSVAAWHDCSRLFFASLRRLSHHQPFVLLIDDAQNYGQIDQTGFMGLWSHGEPGSRCVVIASCAEAAPESGLEEGGHATLQNVVLEWDQHAHRRWQLGPMQDREMIEMAMPILKSLGLSEDREREASAKLFEAIAHSSRGVPQTLFDILQMMAERNGAAENWTQWVADIGELDIARLRFSRLSRESQQILELLAIAIEPVTFRQLQVASRVGPEILFPHVGSLVRRGWLRWRGTWPDLLIEPHGNASALQIRGWTDEGRQKRRHARLAKAMTYDLHPPWMTIGKHYRLAGKTRRAAAALRQAVDQFEKSGEHQLRDEALSLLQNLEE